MTREEPERRLAAADSAIVTLRRATLGQQAFGEQVLRARKQASITAPEAPAESALPPEKT